MNGSDDELTQLLAEAVARLSTHRFTFTDDEALASIWERGYDISPQGDPGSRFALAAETDGKHRRQWRLQTQALANDRLLDALTAGTWDGRNLEAQLARLDAEDQVHYVFCPSDPRFLLQPDGTLEGADREQNVALPAETQAALDALGPALLEQWRAEGAEPLTVRQLTERLASLGWPDAHARNGWLLVRAWLLRWRQVSRVGQDYWVPADAIPKEPEHARLQVLPVTGVPLPIEAVEVENGVAALDATAHTVKQAFAPAIEKSQQIPGREVIGHQVSWKQPLRTIHLLAGFLPIPAKARSAYPPRGIGEGDREVLRGLWFESDKRMWLWLDRGQDRLYGPDLAQQLEWCDAGDVLRIEWRPEVVVLRLVGHDDAISREETRLVNPEALKALRGGLGETYRQSLQAILMERSEGWTFAQVVEALRERQGHAVSRSTVRALLYAGGFAQHDGRWFADPDNKAGARQLRTALVEALILEEQGEPAHPLSRANYLQTRIRAIHSRLVEIVNDL